MSVDVLTAALRRPVSFVVYECRCGASGAPPFVAMFGGCGTRLLFSGCGPDLNGLLFGDPSAYLLAALGTEATLIIHAV